MIACKNETSLLIIAPVSASVTNSRTRSACHTGLRESAAASGPAPGSVIEAFAVAIAEAVPVCLAPFAGTDIIAAASAAAVVAAATSAAAVVATATVASTAASAVIAAAAVAAASIVPTITSTSTPTSRKSKTTHISHSPFFVGLYYIIWDSETKCYKVGPGIFVIPHLLRDYLSPAAYPFIN